MRCFTLKISEYSSIQDAINTIPTGVTHLDLIGIHEDSQELIWPNY